MQCYSCKLTRGRSRRKNNTNDDEDDDDDGDDEFIIINSKKSQQIKEVKFGKNAKSDPQSPLSSTSKRLEKRLRRLIQNLFAQVINSSSSPSKIPADTYIRVRLPEHKTSITTSTTLTNGSIVTGSIGGHLVFYQFKATSNTYLTHTRWMGRERGAIRSMVALDNGEFACGFTNGSLLVWNSEWTHGVKYELDNGGGGGDLNDQQSTVWSLTLFEVSKQHRFLASGTCGEIKIWDLDGMNDGDKKGGGRRRRKKHSIKDCEYIALCMTSLSDDGDLASGYNDGTIIVWHLSMNILFMSHKLKCKLNVSWGGRGF
jgi:WD40 repeat protein